MSIEANKKPTTAPPFRGRTVERWNAVQRRCWLCLTRSGRCQDYSAEQVASILLELYRDFLKDLLHLPLNEDIRRPPVRKQILAGWLEGLCIDAIADLPAVKEAGLTETDITAFIDEFCGVHLPWALNAVRGYVGYDLRRTRLLRVGSAVGRPCCISVCPRPRRPCSMRWVCVRARRPCRCAEHCREPAESTRLTANRWRRRR